MDHRAARRPKVVVIGGGITGLATAWRLMPTCDVTLLEAGQRVGGMVRTVALAGVPFDVGADAFLARRPEGTQLVRELGFADHDLVAPATGQVMLWHDKRRLAMPAKTVMGLPTSMSRVAVSNVLHVGQMLRAGIEPMLGVVGSGRRGIEGDLSVGALVTQRFGRAVTDRLVDPLLAGVYAGDVDQLSVEATMPALWSAAQTGGSLTRQLRRHLARSAGAGPVFVTVRGGLSRVIERLAELLGDRLRRGEAAAAINAHPTATGSWHVTTVTGGQFEADHVILAVPTGIAASLLSEVDAVVAADLARMQAASVAVVALAYPNTVRDDLPHASGILAGRDSRQMVKAVTISSRKWPHLAAHEHVFLRASVGRIDDERPLELSDDDLVERVSGEVAQMLGITVGPVASVVARWPRALPQYTVHHRSKIQGLRQHLASAAPGIHLSGAAFDGLGLTARAAESLDISRRIGG